MSTPWQPPQYEEIRIRPGYTDWDCPRCGTVVTNLIAHNRHHKSLDDLRDSIVALTQVLVPGLPPGVMLTPQSGIKINVVPDSLSVEIHGELGGQGGVSSDGTFATGGEGGFGLDVGRGGKGNDPLIPECPICLAVGGGGHGGGCKNAGKPVSQWVS